MKDIRIEASEAEVLKTYEQLSQKLIAHGYRHNAFYLARKAIVDWDLLTSAEIKNKKVLNVGCFEPIDELHWAGLVGDWTAIDLSPTSIDVARRIVAAELHPDLVKKLRFEVMDAQQLSFPPDSFDVVVSFSVIDHIPDPSVRQRSINEMARVVKPGGHVIITVPNRYSYYHLLYNRNVRRGVTLDVGFQYFYSKGELRRSLREAGLRPQRFTSDFKNVGDFPKLVRGLLMPFSLFGDRMGYLAIKD
jgi:SAM-dependent methyltransferase